MAAVTLINLSENRRREFVKESLISRPQTLTSASGTPSISSNGRKEEMQLTAPLEDDDERNVSTKCRNFPYNYVVTEVI